MALPIASAAMGKVAASDTSVVRFTIETPLEKGPSKCSKQQWSPDRSERAHLCDGTDRPSEKRPNRRTRLNAPQGRRKIRVGEPVPACSLDEEWQILVRRYLG